MKTTALHNHRIHKNTFGSGDFTTTEFSIRNESLTLYAEVVDNRHEALPIGHTVWLNTPAAGRLTGEQAEAFVEVIQQAIAEAKRRATV